MTEYNSVREVLKSHEVMVQQLKSDDYQEISGRLNSDSDVIDVLHGAIGVSTESGEILDQVKRHLFYGTELDGTNFVEEVGDLLYYVQLICYACDFCIEDALIANIGKLRARYGDKFTKEKALNRDLEKEREVLEFSDRNSLGVAPK